MKRSSSKKKKKKKESVLAIIAVNGLKKPASQIFDQQSQFSTLGG
jgi:hypothetical protein